MASVYWNCDVQTDDPEKALLSIIGTFSFNILLTKDDVYLD